MSRQIADLFARLASRYPLVALAFLMGLPEEAQVEWRQMYLLQWSDTIARLGV